MKLSLRAALMTILLALVLFTVLGLGVISYYNARTTADDLSMQVLEQTSERIDDQVNDLLRTATDHGNLNRRLLETGTVSAEDFSRLARLWLPVMEVHPRLTRLSFGLEETGEWFYVRRLPNGAKAVGELRRNRRTKKLELSDYWPKDYPGKPFYFNPSMDEEDPRVRPWYTAARKAGRQVWSPTYRFFGVEGVADMPGVSCATPVRRADGTLAGVLTTSFDLRQISEYLRDLKIGRTGYAFLVEFRADGRRQVIAHPHPEILFRPVRENGHGSVVELVPTEELPDRPLAGFLNHVPATFPANREPMAWVHFVLEGTHYLGGIRAVSSADAPVHGRSSAAPPDWLICILLPESEVLEGVHRANRQTILFGLIILLGAVLVSVYVARKVARPLEDLASQAHAIGQWQIAARPVVRSTVLEVQRLARAMEEMKTGLRSFQKYVPADLIRAMLAAGQEARLGGEARVVTIFFCDIANFTSISESLPPAQLVEHLGEYLQALSAEIQAAGGTVDKYIGDAIMAFWGAPAPDPRHALGGCRAALGCRRKLAELHARWKVEGKPLLHARTGLHTGEAVVGNIGSDARLNYTLIGDAVNLANRVEGLNKYYGTDILITENTYGEVRDAVVARPVDWVHVKGKNEAVLVYELLGLEVEVDAETRALADLSARALAGYRRREWAAALQLFEQVLAQRPDDGPAHLMGTRCQAYQAQPPGEDWDGAYRMQSK
jgi:adenylate cyclase